MDEGTRLRLARTLQRRLGRNLREERLRRSLTQEELADQAGIAPRHLQKLEAGCVNATIKSLAALAHALGIPADALLRADQGDQQRD